MIKNQDTQERDHHQVLILGEKLHKMPLYSDFYLKQSRSSGQGILTLRSVQSQLWK